MITADDDSERIVVLSWNRRKVTDDSGFVDVAKDMSRPCFGSGGIGRSMFIKSSQPYDDAASDDERSFAGG